MYRAALLLAVASVVAAPVARADDWLALHPECAFDATVVEPGRMAILYPRPGLPAVVAQGDRLVTRVRVPSGLTPPPGIQQDRALVGWDAQLVGAGTAIDPAAEHRYPLRVVDVRPDGGSSLVYRATILVPHWAAPGTYGLRLSAPGGSDAMPGSVRIISRGAAPRIALARFDAPAENENAEQRLARIAALVAHVPADVFVTADDPALRAALAHAETRPMAPMLLLPTDADSLAVVLRHGDDAAFVLGRCEGGYVSFDAQVEGVMREENRSARPLDRARLPEAGRFAWLDAPERALSFGREPPAEADLEGEALTLKVAPDHPGPATFTVVVPDDGRATEIAGAADGSIAWYPATPVRSVESSPSLAARFLVAPGATAHVRRGEGEPLSLSLSAQPEDPETGSPVALRASPSRPVGIVAWRLDEDVTAVGEEAGRAYGPLGLHRIHALAIAPDGVADRAETTIHVRTQEATGCDCGVSAPRPPGSLLFWLTPLGLLLRPRRRRRNIGGPRER